MPGKIEEPNNFRSSVEFKRWLNDAIAKLDEPGSKVIRTCIMIALPSILANPSLVDHVRFEDMIKDVKNQ